jgi:T5SS/PEP-CTERM-associated repeat protein
MRHSFVRRTYVVLMGTLLITVLTAQAGAVDRAWIDTSVGLNNWNDATNWNPSDDFAKAADNALFDADASYFVIVAAPSAANNVTFTDGSVTLGGGSLNSGGVVTIDDVLAAGLGDGATVILNGPNWDNVGDAFVGDEGFGSFTLNASGDFRSQDIFIGNQVGSVGVVNVDGPETTLQTDGLNDTNGFFIGNAGTGTLNVTGGGLARIVNDVSGGIANFDLGVTADGEGTLNIMGGGVMGPSQVIAEDVIIGNLGTGHVNITAGGVLNQNINGDPDAFVALQLGSSGDVTVSGNGSQWLMERLEIGNLGDGTLSIEDGGLVRSNNNDMALADAGGSGKVAVFGTPDTGSGANISTLEVTNNLFVGSNGLGELRVGVDLDADLNSDPLGAGHASLEVGTHLRIGSPSGNQLENIAYISGPNTSVTVGSVLYAGENGRGTLELRDGATLTAAFPRIGSGAMSNGTLVVTGTGTTFTGTNDFVVATNGTGNATVSDGAILDNAGDFWVGHQADAVGRLTIDDATVNATTSNAGNLQVGGRIDGSGGAGTLIVQNGGTLNVSDETYIGGNSTSSGILFVQGLGSTYFQKDGGVNDLLRIGYGGAGFVLVREGGRIDAEGIVIGSLAGSAQALLVANGADGGTPSTIDIDGFLYVGDARQGIMVVEQGARARVATSLPAERLIIGDDNAADGSWLTVTGAGSRLDYLGTGDVSVGNAGGSTSNRATLEVNNGGVFSAVQRNPDMSIASQARIIVGDVANGNGHIIVDGAGSRVEASVIYVGDGDSSSSGILDITNGGTATTTGDVEVGSFGSGVGTVNVDGPTSSLNVGTILSLGDDTFGGATNGANGTLNITAGGTVTNGGQAYIGHYTGSFGTATVGSATANTSSWSIGGELTIAGTETSSQLSGSGKLDVNTGGLVTIASNLRIRNLGDVNLSGGEIRVGDEIIYTDAGSTFNFGTGTLRFTEAGTHNLDFDQLDRLLGSSPTLVSNQHLAVDGTATINAPLRVNGGTLSVGSTNFSSMANVDFDAGTLNFTNSGLNVSATGLFGATLVVDDSQTINVANQLNVAGTGLLSVSRGAVSANDAVNNGTTVVAGGSITVATTFVNSGDLILVDGTINGNLTNNGDLTVVNTSGLGSLSLNGSGSASFGLDGDAGIADLLDIAGSAQIGGALSVSADNLTGFALGQQFDLITATAVSGIFASENLPSLGGGLGLDVLYEPTRVALQVISIAGLAGDYNQNGTVDAADYTVWRDNLGSGTSLPNDDTAGVAQDDYDRWKSNFGNVAAGSGAGSASGAGSSAAVPEPATIGLLALALFAFAWRRQI